MNFFRNKAVIITLIIVALGAGGLFYLKSQNDKAAEPVAVVQPSGAGREIADTAYRDVLSKAFSDFIEAGAGAIIKSDRGEKEIASAATLDEVRSLLEMLADKGIRYDDISAGDQPDDITITGLRSDDFRVAVLTIGKLNYAAVTGLLTGGGNNSAPLFARMRAETITIGAPAAVDRNGEAEEAETGQDHPVQIASIELGTLSFLWPEAASWKKAGAPAASEKASDANEEASKKANEESAEEPSQNLRIQIANMLGALAIDGAIIRNFRAQIGVEEVDYQIDEFRLGSIEGGDLKYLAIAGIKNQSTPGFSTFLAPPLRPASPSSFLSETPLLAVEGGSIAGLLPYLRSGQMPPKTADDLITFKAGYISASRNYVDDTLYNETSASYGPPIAFVGLVPKKVTLSPRPARFFIKPLFEAFASSLEKVSGADQRAEIGRLIEKYFAAEGLDYASAMKWAYDAKADDVALDISLASPQLAGFTVAFDGADIPLHELIGAMLGLAGEKNRDDPELASKLAATRLDSFELMLTDHQLLALVFDIVALNAPGTGGQIRASIPLLISLQAGSLAEETPRIKPIAEAISAFISKGGTLTIKADPPAEIEVSNLFDNADSLGEIIDLAGLEVSHAE